MTVLKSISRKIRSHKRSKQRSRRLFMESLEERQLLTVVPGVNFSAGSQVRTYRLAFTTTAEATAALGGQANTQMFATNLTNAISNIFERDLSIRFTPVVNNGLYYTNAATDPYVNNAVCGLASLLAVQQGNPPNCTNSTNPATLVNTPAINNAIGAAAYDIGHVIATGGRGGLAGPSIGVTDKANGATDLIQATSAQLLNVNSTQFRQQVVLVAHEIGHQFGADHSFNGRNGACNARSTTTAYEPGSGSTIMGYQPICGTDGLTVLPGDETYFHAASFDQIIKTVNANPAVGTVVATNNNLPTVNGGNDFVIPVGTPFTLAATGNDADAGDNLTYTWEQVDNGGASKEVLVGPALTVNGQPATAANTLNQLDQTTVQYVNGDTITITGTDSAGTNVNGTYTYNATHTLANLFKDGFIGTSISTSFSTFPTVSFTPTGAIQFEAGNARTAALALSLTPGAGATGRTTFGNFAVALEGTNDVTPNIGNVRGVSVPITNANDAVGPLFRSFAPTTNPSRMFPRLQDVVDGGLLNGEHLPSQPRTLNFRVTARDNHAFAGGGGVAGGVASDDVMITVVNAAGPFSVNFNEVAGGQVMGGNNTINWNVAGTNPNLGGAHAGASTTTVDILFSQDGGATFPITLATGVPNNGTANVFIPNSNIAQARVMVRATQTQNIFFDVNNANFQVMQNLAAPGALIITPSGGNTTVGEGPVAPANDTYTVALSTAPVQPVTVTITADAQTQVSTNGTTFATTQTVTFPAGVNAPLTITVRAVNDMTGESVHTSTIANKVTASTDPNYNPAFAATENLTVTVNDDEDGPLIGVDFDDAGGAMSPVNWTLATGFQNNTTTLNNLQREDGQGTAIDLTIAVNTLAGGSGFANVTATTVPQHTPNLVQVGNDTSFNSPLTATWSQLKPNQGYRVYVFQANTNVNQQVAITGNGVNDPAAFNQVTTGAPVGQLLVNDMAGVSTANLSTLGKTVTSNAMGQVMIQITPNAGTSSLAGLAIQEIPVPLPSFTVMQTGGGTQVTEAAGAGNTDTFTVQLDTQPAVGTTVNVTVTPLDMTEVTAAPTMLAFNNTNWNMGQTVTVTGANDTAVDGNQTTAVNISATGYTTVPVNVTTVDDDLPSFTIMQTGGGTQVTEAAGAGNTDTFTVQLDTQPAVGTTVNVTVTAVDMTEVTASPTMLTFNSTNWNVGQTVMVTGANDTAVDGNQMTNVNISATGYTTVPVNVTTVDDDLPSFTVMQTGGGTQVTEAAGAGNTDTFTVQLDTQPAVGTTVNVTVAALDMTEVTAAPTMLAFNSTNWNVGQTVTVTGANDTAVDGNQTTAVNISATGYTTVPVNVTTVDDDLPSFTIMQTGGGTQVTEAAGAGNTDTFTVQLDTQPAVGTTVNVTVAALDMTEVTATPTMLTFNSTNWNVGQTVTVTGANDTAVDGNQTTAVNISATGYTTVPVNVTTVDDDLPSFTIMQTGAGTQVTEAPGAGNTDTFSVQLDTQPAVGTTVNVTVAALDMTEVTVAPTMLAFNSTNWNVGQTVTVTGANDTAVDGNQMTNVNISATGYTTVPVVVTTIDDEQPSFTILQTGGGTQVTEAAGAGNTDTFTVQLDTQPAVGTTVNVTIASTDLTEATAAPTMLVFNSTNWNVGQTVTVTGANDTVVDGTQMTNVNISATGYTTVPVVVTTVDDDLPSFTVTQTGGGTQVTEAAGAGNTDTFTVQLDTQPAAGTTVNVTVAALDMTEVTVAPTMLTFNSMNWNVGQTVTVTGANDTAVDGNQMTNVNISANGYTTVPVNVTTIDDEQPSFTIMQTGGGTQVTEAAGAGNTDTFTVQLDTQPAVGTTVNVTVAAIDMTEVTAAPTMLAFNSTNWNVGQTVTVTGANDTAVDGNQMTNVNISAAGYATVPVVVTTIDDDLPSFTITQTGGGTQVTEAAGAGNTDTFTVQLDTQPAVGTTVNVTVAAIDMTEVTAAPTMLTFNSTNWNAGQTVTVTGANDPTADGNQMTNVNISATGYTTVPVVVTTIDDEQPSFTILQTGGGTQVTEAAGAGNTDTFTVQLDTQPAVGTTVNVTIASTDLTEATAAPTMLVFNSTNWNVGQTVTVTGADDPITDGNQMTAVNVSAAGYTTVPVNVTTVDNDVPGFTIAQTGGGTSVTEAAGAGSTDTFTVQLTTQPTAGTTVTLNVTSPDTGEATASSVPPLPLVFTPANWNVAQTVTITGVDDPIDDGNQATNVSVSIVAGGTLDPAYATVMPQTVPVTTVDDDAPVLVVVQSAGNTQVSEALTTDTFTVALGAQPATNVVVSVTSGTLTEATVDKPTLTFTPQNFNQPQTVTVTGVDDAAVDGAQNVNITVSVVDAQSDNAFDPAPDVIVVATNIDNEATANIPRGDHIVNSQVGTFTAARPAQDYQFTIPAGTPSADYVFMAVTPPGSNVANAVPTVSQNGQPIAPNNVESTGTKSLVRVTLGPGTYVVRARSANAATGAYELVWMMPGVVAAAQPVSNVAVQNTVAANLFAGLGTNHVAAEWLQQQGITPTTNTYRPGYDANANGRIDPFDLDSVSRNHGKMRPNGTLAAMQTAPGNPRPAAPQRAARTEGEPAPTVWQNAARPSDVNGSGTTSLVDAMAVINYIHQNGLGQLPETSNSLERQFVDVHPDNHVDISDAIAVVRHLHNEQRVRQATVDNTSYEGGVVLDLTSDNRSARPAVAHSQFEVCVAPSNDSEVLTTQPNLPLTSHRPENWATNDEEFDDLIDLLALDAVDAE